METDLVIAGLSRKRDEIDGELRQVEQRISALRTDSVTIEAAIAVFDPSRTPAKATTPRKAGSFSRAILGALRTAGRPLTVREIAERIETERGQETDREALIHNVRNTVARHAGKGLRREELNGAIVWSVG